MPPSPPHTLADFLAKYDPPIASRARACRAKPRKLLPTACEFIYDNYNALVIGDAPTERASDAIISIALYPKWVTLFFLQGASLSDPHGLLKGRGKQARSIVIDDPADLDSPGIRALIAAAIEDAEPPFPDRGKIKTIIKSISTKQRPRRPKPRVKRNA